MNLRDISIGCVTLGRLREDVKVYFVIIYIMLLSDLKKLLSAWENVLSIANVT